MQWNPSPLNVREGNTSERSISNSRLKTWLKDTQVCVLLVKMQILASFLYDEISVLNCVGISCYLLLGCCSWLFFLRFSFESSDFVEPLIAASCRLWITRILICSLRHHLSKSNLEVWKPRMYFDINQETYFVQSLWNEHNV